MTVNELEQAIRNLMVSQPMISAGPMGGVVTSAISILGSYRNLTMSAQSYPVQDNFKFNLTAELQRLENTLAMTMCQAFQEKGINIMGYMMPTAQTMMTPQSNLMPNSVVMPNASVGVMPNSYVPPVVPPVQTQGTHSHLAFNQPMGGPRFGANNNRPMAGAGQSQYPMGAPQGPSSQMGQYGGQMNQPPQNRPMMGPATMGGPAPAGGYPRYPQNPQMRGPRPMPAPGPAYPRNPAPVQPPVSQVQPPMPEEPKDDLPRPVVQPSKASLKSQELNPTKPAVTKASSKPPILLDTEPDDLSMSSVEEPSGSAAGRDYLLQLLKK